MSSLSAKVGYGGAETCLGLPRCRDPSRLDAAIAILGADGCTPYPSVGFCCAGGPAAIRAASAPWAADPAHMNFDLGGPLLPAGVSAVDLGDLPQDIDDAPGNRARIFGAVSTILDRRGVPVLIGGDDSLPIPMIEAFGARGHAYNLLQIDAQIDWCDAVEGERFGAMSTMRRASGMAHVEAIVQVGQRGIGSARETDLADARAWGVGLIPAGEVARAGVWRAVDLVAAGSEVILCFDLAALDPTVMPAVHGRAGGGLSYWQVLELVGAVAEKARIAGVAMVELAPTRDIDGQGAGVAAQLLAAIIGVIARQA